MSFESSLKALLAGDSGIGAIVGERIHPLLLPEESTKPAIVYTVIGLQPATDLDSADGSLLEVRLQLECWSRSHSEMIELAELVRLRMQAATISANAIVMGSCFRQDDYDQDARLYRGLFDFNCWYRTS